MEEYKQLYELYQSKTDSELENIINSNEYTPIAIKVASDILKYGRIGYEEIINLQDGTITLPKPDSKLEKYEKTTFDNSGIKTSSPIIHINNIEYDLDYLLERHKSNTVEAARELHNTTGITMKEAIELLEKYQKGTLDNNHITTSSQKFNLTPFSQKLKISLVLLISYILLLFVFRFLLPHEDTNTSSIIEITQQQSRTESLTQQQKITSASTAAIAQKTTNAPAPTVEHRTGENIVGISDKSLSGIRFAVNKVQNDVTGNWKISTINEDIDIEYYAAAYAKLYIHNKSQVHAIVNFTRNTTTSIKKDGNIIYVDIYDYVNGEEFDADLLFTGTLLQQYFVYVDNGDIEKIYVESNENNITETEHDMTDTTSANENNIEETEPDITATTSANVFTYVLNTSTKKFHIPRCSEVKKIKATNYSEYTGTYDEVTSMRYVACKKCRPH